MIEKATKEQAAEVARLLALNIGYDHEKYGDVPQETLLRMVRAETLDEETKRLLVHGMQNLASALGEVMGLSDDGEEEAVHSEARGGHRNCWLTSGGRRKTAHGDGIASMYSSLRA